MAHIRQQIRHAVTALIKGSALVAERVEPSRARSLRRNELTSAFVYTSAEQSEDIDTTGTQERAIRVKIDTVTKGEEDARQDDLDDFAVFVEAAFANDPRLGGLVNAIQYRTTDFATSTEGEKTFQVMSMTYDVSVLTQNSDPETAL